MSGDRELLAERSAAVLRHLDRVADHLPADPSAPAPLSSATDTDGPADLRAFLAALRDRA